MCQSVLTNMYINDCSGYVAVLPKCNMGVLMRSDSDYSEMWSFDSSLVEDSFVK